VPLSAQEPAILRDLQPNTGEGMYVFPSVLSYARPMSENTVNAACAGSGPEKNEMTGHGFRSITSSLARMAARSDREATGAS
jgi:hypothetical protein